MKRPAPIRREVTEAEAIAIVKGELSAVLGEMAAIGIPAQMIAAGAGAALADFLAKDGAALFLGRMAADLAGRVARRGGN